MKSTFYAVLTLSMAVVPAFSGTLYVDTNSNLYTVDETTGVTTQVTLTGAVTSFVGARGMAFGANGDLYVADYGAGQVYQVDGSGNVTSFETLGGAYGVTANGSNIVVSTYNGAGQVLTYSDSGGAALSTLTTGSTNLADLVYGPNGDLYVSAQGAAGVLQYDGTSWTIFASLSGNSNAPTPRGLVFDGGELYVADSSTNTAGGSGSGIYEFTVSGTDTADGLSAGPETEIFNTYNDATRGLIEDPSTGLLYLAESLNNASAGGEVDAIDAANPASSQSPFPTTLASAEDFALVSTPEPGTMMMMIGGLAIAGFRLRKRIF